MSRELLLALIGGIASAILSLGSFGPAPIVAVGLALGWSLASISAAVAAMLLLLFLGSPGAIQYIAITAAPALIIVRLALIVLPGTAPGATRWYPPGQILAWLTAYSLGILALTTLYFEVAGPGIRTASTDFLRAAMDQLFQQSGIRSQQGLDPEKIAALPELYARMIGPILPGLAVSGSLLLLVPNATIAQGILVRMGHALRPSPAYAALVLPRWLVAALAAAMVIAFLPGALGGFGSNAALVIATPFLLLGLAVIHTLSRRAPKPGHALAAVYITLFLLGILFGLAVFLLGAITLLGLLEQWISLRRRFGKGGANQEDE